MRTWSEPVDLPFLLSQTKYNRSLAPVEADVDSATNGMVAQCRAGDQQKSDLIRTHTRLYCCGYMRKWSEPVDLPFLLSQTKYNRSLAPVEADVDSATNGMVAQCGAGDLPKSDLIRTHTRL